MISVPCKKSYKTLAISRDIAVVIMHNHVLQYITHYVLYCLYIISYVYTLVICVTVIRCIYINKVRINVYYKKGFVLWKHQNKNKNKCSIVYHLSVCTFLIHNINLLQRITLYTVLSILHVWRASRIHYIILEENNYVF